MFYSKSKNTWYSSEFRSDYEANGTWPDDAKEYPFEVYQAVVSNRAPHQIMQPDENGDPILVASPLPTAEELMQIAVNEVKNALQAVIDEKATSLGFSSGNALMLYAGFTNAFQPVAKVFAQWEASVWVAADAYKDEVIAGTKPMLDGAAAVAMMPEYPSAS